jgi:hypothetical protein
MSLKKGVTKFDNSVVGGEGRLIVVLNEEGLASENCCASREPNLDWFFSGVKWSFSGRGNQMMIG